MLDLTALPKRYLDSLGKEKVAEITGVSSSVLSMWVSRGTFPVDAIQKLLEADPTPIHEIRPLYTVPETHPRVSVIVPASSPPSLNTTRFLLKLMDAEMQLEPECFNSLYHVRNMAAGKFLASGREWSYWSDSDMVGPCGDAAWFKAVTRQPNYPDIYAGLNTIYRLMFHKKTIVSLVYIEKMPHGAAAVFQGGDDPAVRQTLSRGPALTVLLRDWCGFGGVLVHRNVFLDIIKGGGAPVLTNPYMKKKLGYEYGFFNPVDDGFGDDISFCVRAKRAGHQVHIDCAVMAAHVGGYSYGYNDLR